jgi:hypothetical protein
VRVVLVDFSDGISNRSTWMYLFEQTVFLDVCVGLFLLRRLCVMSRLFLIKVGAVNEVIYRLFLPLLLPLLLLGLLFLPLLLLGFLLLPLPLLGLLLLPLPLLPLPLLPLPLLGLLLLLPLLLLLLCLKCSVQNLTW